VAHPSIAIVATPKELQFRTVDVDRIERTYWLPDNQPRAPSPLLIAFHGLAMTGRNFALWTRLAERGPAAGFATVFPDALGRVWDDHGTVRRDGGDDAAFVQTLITRLRNTGACGDRPVLLIGFANGASFAERIARNSAVDVAGLALVAGTAREASRRKTPTPLQPTPVLAFLGTADRSTPFEGGRARAWFRREANLRVRLALADTSGHGVVAAQTLIEDWTQANGAAGEPRTERLEAATGDPPVVRLTWPPHGADVPHTADSDAGDRAPVVVYRIDGGGHGWPGGRAGLITRLGGRVPKQLDATGIILDFGRLVHGLDEPVSAVEPGESPSAS
jgi:polyhydroxybutyrate depolymerase